MKALVAGGFVLVVALAFGGCAIGTRNDLVRQENGIKAQYKQNQNSFAAMTNKVREIAQVPEMARDDLDKITRGAIEGRYGKDGSKAVFQFIQEQNPNIDPSLYRAIQQAIESGREQFAQEQKMLLDKKRVYENNLATFPENMVAGLFGFPKIDLDQFDIVTSQETENAFNSKKAGPMKLR